MNLVKESISFERGKDPKKALGLSFKADIEEWLNFHKIEYWSLNHNLQIEARGIVYLSGKGIEMLPEYINFEYAREFYCDDNKLISLRGFPRIVSGNFSCKNNRLTCLIGGPEEVGHSYYINNNLLTSLIGCPSIVYGSFWCKNNIKQFTEDEVRKYCDVKRKVKI